MALNDINSTIDRGEDTRADADDATLEASAESVADDVDDTDDANMLAAATAPVDAPDVVTPAAESATAFSTTSTAVAASAAAAAKEQARNAAAYNLGAWAVTERGFNITVEPRDAVERSDYNRAWQEVENGMENECNSRINGSSSCSEHSTEDEPMQQENDVNETDLARAIAVEEGDDDVFNGPRGDLPTALELDPDAKSAAFHARSKINFYGMFVASMVLLVVLTATITWQLVHIPQIPAALSDRATLGIREYITQQLLVRLPADIGGGNRSKEDVEQLLNDPTDPYRKALDWIQNEDPMALTPDSAKFIQRFLAAYLYFSTSVDHPWSNGCEPLLPTTAPSTSSANDQGAGARPGDNSCVHVFGDAVFGDAAYVGYTNEMVAKRWLSSDDECLWGGVHCDWDGNIVVLDFCTFLEHINIAGGKAKILISLFLACVRHWVRHHR